MASVETEFKYRGLHSPRASGRRSAATARRTVGFPVEFAFEGVPGLSREVVDRLSQVRPSTLGQAGRVPGVTPAALSVIAAYIDRPVHSA